MSGVSPLRQINRNALALCMCLLAFAFAVEAKIAWYGPPRGPGSAVRAEKAQPVKLPEVVAHGVPTPNPIHPEAHSSLLGKIAPPSLGNAQVLVRAVASIDHPSSVSPYLGCNLFFRPPPVG